MYDDSVLHYRSHRATIVLLGIQVRVKTLNKIDLSTLSWKVARIASETPVAAIPDGFSDQARGEAKVRF